MVLVADVSLYCELSIARNGNLVGFYFRDDMQVPFFNQRFLTLSKLFTDMVFVADVSSYCELRLAHKRNLVSFYFRDVTQFHVL